MDRHELVSVYINWNGFKNKHLHLMVVYIITSIESKLACNINEYIPNIEKKKTNNINMYLLIQIVNIQE